MVFNVEQIFEIHEELLNNNKMERVYINKGIVNSNYDTAMLEFKGNEV